jgi:ubiquinone biosynthesis protein UbiJ
MATQSPFFMLESFLQNLNLPLSPPAWAIDEVHRRIVLLLNHVLMQEPQAVARLVRQKGRVVLMRWRSLTFRVVVSPAGLLNLAAEDPDADLVLELTEDSPLTVAQDLVRGEKPAVRIEGDVQLAAEVSWLIDHVRWDIEEDLARIVGDATASALVQTARSIALAMQRFVGRSGGGQSGGSSA